MNTGIYWLQSLSTDAPAAPESLSATTITDASNCPGGILIAHILTEDDALRAFDLLENSCPAPLWICEPATSVASALRWMKAGATHIAASDDELVSLLEQEMEARDFAAASSRLCNSSLKGISRAIRAVDADISLIAGRRCSVLIEGETGTGKEVVARAIHESGSRPRAPWVPVNCGAIPESLLEAELFGHVRGAFTGAVQSRPGKFEAANHGTIFLDEIGEMPLSVQAKLLRVLQEREVERLGGNERIRLDVRVIAATNLDLAERVRQGLFRQDLFYRLNVFRMVLPSLRERPEDVPVLARHFIEKICVQEGIPVKSLDSSAIDLLQSHAWPGNVRELENAVETAIVRSGSRLRIFASDLRLTRTTPRVCAIDGPATAALPFEGLDYQRALEDFEKGLLTQALSRARGNKTAAADLLGLKRTTLAAKLKVLESRMPRLVA